MRFQKQDGELRIGPLVLWVRRCRECRGLLWNAEDWNVTHDGACRMALRIRTYAQVHPSVRGDL